MAEAFIIIGSIVVVLIIILGIRTLCFKNIDQQITIKEMDARIDVREVANKLAKAVQIPTISYIDLSKVDWSQFRKYHQVIEEMFPLVHQKLHKETINEYSLLYHWKGKSTDKKPILITAHMDVVPVSDWAEQEWKYPPFSGEIINGYVWGRGTLDTKITMIAALEAAELLLKENFMPDRDIYFAFGHDEETRGEEGALKIMETLKMRSIEFEFLIDEGGCVVENIISDIQRPLALVGIAEKGYANINIKVSDNGGHASMPPKHTALGTLAKVIMNMEDHQLRLQLTKPIENFLKKIGPEMKGINKFILANLWLFKPIFLRVFSKTKSGNALLRTTTAATMATASVAANVLPQEATATFNFRVAPGDKIEDIEKHIKQVNKDISIEVETLIGDNPSKVSSIDSEGFKTIECITKEIFADVLVSPYIVLAGTDARKYEPICENLYRFAPYQITNEELDKIHSNNENISIDNISKCVQFYLILFEEM